MTDPTPSHNQHSEDRASDGTGASPPLARSYPLEVFPPPLRAFILAEAKARSVPTSVVGTLVLVAMGSAIGLSRVFHDSYADWTEPPILWAALVMPSGSGKSPVLRDVFRVHTELQAQRSLQHRQLLREYEAVTRGRRGSETPADEPPKPTMQHVLTSNATTEAVTGMLETSPRGVLALVDELSGLFGGFGRYSGDKDADRAFWLSLHSLNPHKVDRASREHVMLERPAAWVAGGIQPATLAKYLTSENVASGLIPRFLFVFPPDQPKEYAPGPDEETRQAYAEIIKGLFALKGTVEDLDGVPAILPLKVDLDADARAVWGEFVREWSLEALEESDALRAAMSKLEGCVARFALILRTYDELEGCDRGLPIEADDLRRGIVLARWYRGSLKRVYGELAEHQAESPATLAERRASVIRYKYNGQVSAAQWHKHNNRRSREVSDAELADLVERGLATWRRKPSGPNGGRPAQVCMVLDQEVSGCGLQGAEVPAPECVASEPGQAPQEPASTWGVVP